MYASLCVLLRSKKELLLSTFPYDLCLFPVYLVRQRKEIALFDLEESYHTEFGSVDLRYCDYIERGALNVVKLTGIEILAVAAAVRGRLSKKYRRLAN